MSFDAAIGVAASCSLALGLGCATETGVHPIHRPPTLAEIGQLNEARGPLVVALIPSAGPSPSIDHIVSADAAKLMVAPEDAPYWARRSPERGDSPYALRLDDVAGFWAHSSGRSAAKGAVTGAAVGGVVDACLLSLAFLLRNAGPPPNPNAPPCTDCSGPNAGTYLAVVLVPVAIGAALGALVGAANGSDEFFPFSLGPPPPLPPRPPTPTGKRSASVVALSAEVRSAPFKVAPVVVVLVQGQRLFVEAAPRDGWRVVYLSDGRAGYIKDAQVKVDLP
jgi:hypothetical protein